MQKITAATLALSFALPFASFAASQTDVSQMIPGQMNSAGFINMKKIFAEYGMFFDGGPLAQQIEQLVAMGAPDPRKENLDQIAFAGLIDEMDWDDVSFFISRTAPPTDDSRFLEKYLEVAANMGLVNLNKEAYRGAEVIAVQDAQKGDTDLFVSDITDTMASAVFSKRADKQLLKLSIDTFQGKNENYASKYGSALAENQYAGVTFEMPSKLQDDLKQTPLAFLALIEHFRASLESTEGKLKLSLDGVCASDEDALLLKLSVKKAFDELRQQIPGGDDEWGFILDSVQFGQDGKTTNVALELPEDLVKELISAITGHNFAD